MSWYWRRQLEMVLRERYAMPSTDISYAAIPGGGGSPGKGEGSILLHCTTPYYCIVLRPVWYYHWVCRYGFQFRYCGGTRRNQIPSRYRLDGKFGC
eukprot:3877485-Rhodomonas_salina.1